jgi:hypothetical protein
MVWFFQIFSVLLLHCLFLCAYWFLLPIAQVIIKLKVCSYFSGNFFYPGLNFASHLFNFDQIYEGINYGN